MLSQLHAWSILSPMNACRRCVPYRLDTIRKAKAASTAVSPSQALQQITGSRGLGLSIAAISRKGYAPGYKEDNQDRCMVVQVCGQGWARVQEVHRSGPWLVV